MVTFISGDLIGVKENNRYYYYLIMSEPLYYGCSWSFAFHKTSEVLLSKSQILSSPAEGFRALIAFQSKVNEKYIYKIAENIDIEPYRVKMNLKVRIDKPDGGHEWYIFNSKLQILRKQKSLKSTQFKYPVASGITYKDANQLIEKKWKTEQIVDEEGRGQFPI